MIRLLFLMFIPFSLMGQDVSCLLKKAECAKNNDALNGEYLNAIERYTSIVEKNSLLAIVYLHIGNSYMLLGFSDQAEKYWSTAKNMGININDKSKTIESAIDLIINGYKLK